jgi:hypothetical protein
MLETAFADAGYRIIIPRQTRLRPQSPGLQVPIASTDEHFAEGVQNAHEFLDRFNAQLPGFQKETRDAELDFGIDCPCPHPVSNHRFEPAFLELLAKLEITLNVTTYT